MMEIVWRAAASSQSSEQARDCAGSQPHVRFVQGARPSVPVSDDNRSAMYLA